ncbi:MAG: efflux RND transporter periplasmic adaptor subunit [Candidatus Krumholzibacteriia bacterium]
MASPRLRRLLPLAVLVLAAVVFVVMIRLRPEPPKRPPLVARPVVEVTAVSDTIPVVRVRGFGSVVAKRSVDVVPQVSGEVEVKSPSFEPGAFFRAGDVLIEVDDTDYVLAVERAAADVARARYNLAMAEEEAAAARREWEQIRGDSPTDAAADLPSALPDAPNPLVFREPQLALARAELSAAEAALRQARVNLERTTIRAPFDGRTLASSVDAGQYVRAGNPVGTIYGTDVAEITVTVPDADLAWIAVPDGTDGAAPVAPVDIRSEFAGGDHVWEGRVVRLGGAVDRQSRQVPVVVEVLDPYRAHGERPPLVEGMFVEAVFRGHAPGHAVAIPRAALRPGDQVWVVTDDETIDVRDVRVARAGVREAIVTGGLQPGDRVVVTNLQYVTDGMQIRVAAGTATPPARAGEGAGDSDVAGSQGAGDSDVAGSQGDGGGAGVAAGGGTP